MSDRIVRTIRDLAGPDLYRRNAFRITGLPTAATRTSVQHLKRRAAADTADVDRRTFDAARDLILGDPARRLVHELFWLWDDPDATCGCDVEVHRAHDDAVLAHSGAIDAEFGVGRPADDLWTRAGRAWSRQAGREEFWNHLRHRAGRLGDTALDTLREELPAALVRPLIDLVAAGGSRQAGLSALARAWPDAPALVVPHLEAITEPLRERLRVELRQVTEQLAAGGVPHDAAKRLETTAVPMLTRLEGVLPAARHPATARLSNDVARAFNTCATRLIGSAGWGALGSADGWLARARALATRPKTIEAIDRNTAALTATVEASYASISSRYGVPRGRAPRPPVSRSDDDLVRAYRGMRPDLSPADSYASDRPAPAPVRVVPPRRPPIGRRLLRLAAWAAAAAGVYLLVVVWHPGLGRPGPRKVSVADPRIAWNAPAGTCLLTEDDWNTDLRTLRSAPCGTEHWGEVLGYRELDGDVYPGDGVLSQTATYECAFLLAGHGLSTGEYQVRTAHTTRQAWDTADHYVTCVLHRADGAGLPLRKLVDADRADAPDLTVTLPMMDQQVWFNPPPGSCVTTRASVGTGDGRAVFVACTQAHWGEILGYPDLYGAGESWPGDTAVRAAATAACASLAAERGLPAGHTVVTEWPRESFWNDMPAAGRYAVCIEARSDDLPIPGTPD